MAFTLRQNKGSPLTHAELDANFSDISNDSDATKGDALVGVKYPVHGVGINLHKWIQGGRVVAGQPSDGIFSSLQDAIDEAADLERGVDFFGEWTVSTTLLLRHKTDLQGQGYESVILLADGADVPVIKLAATSNIDFCRARNFLVYGNKANQTLSTAHGFDIDNSADSGAIPRYIFENIVIRDCKGSSFKARSFCRAMQVKGVQSYAPDEYGFDLACSDSQFANLDAGQSGKDGFRITGGALQLMQTKAWLSGRLTAGSAGYLYEDCTNIQHLNALSQGSSGEGYLLFGNAAALEKMVIDGVSYEDNAGAGGDPGMTMSNVNGAKIKLAVYAGSSGTPANGLSIGATSVNNDIELTTKDITGAAVTGAGVGNNNIRVNGDPNVFINYQDDFIGDLLADEWAGFVGSNGSCVTPTIITTSTRGRCRLTTGADAGGTMALNGSELVSNRQWAANLGGVMIEIRVTISAITNVACFIGLTDDAAALEIPIESAASGDNLTTNATDAVGVMFDTSMATDNWWLTGVANNMDATAQNSALAPVAGTFETWRIVLSSSGSASFFRKGTDGRFSQIGSTMSGAVTSSTVLTPVVAALSRAGASRNIDVDFIRITCIR